MQCVAIIHFKSEFCFVLSKYSVDDVKFAVKNNSKKRYGLTVKNGELHIRANQGHSMDGTFYFVTASVL